jgi:hypothetical protein
MSYELQRKAIAVRINSGFTAYPIFDENQGEQQPAGTFGRFNIRPVDANYQGAGALGRRINALLWFQIFLKEGSGVSDAMKFSDAVRALFDNQVVITDDGERMLFRVTELNYIGIEPSGRPMWRAIVPYIVDGA